jgi:hypothetical protein
VGVREGKFSREINHGHVTYCAWSVCKPTAVDLKVRVKVKVKAKAKAMFTL